MLGQRNGDISTSKAGRSCTEKFDGYQLQADKSSSEFTIANILSSSLLDQTRLVTRSDANENV